MTDTRFTPGPLKVRKAHGHKNEPIFLYVEQDLSDDEGYRGLVAQCHPAEHIGGVTREEMFANAHLYAAAPDLYEALEAELLDHLCDAQSWAEAGDHQAAEYHQKRANKLEALLAKARGEA